MLKLDFLKKRGARLALLAVSAVLTGLTVCYPVLGILEWMTLIPAFAVFYDIAKDRELRLRRVYLYGFFFSMCYFVAVWHWFFAMYPMEYTGMNAPTALFVVILAVLGIPIVQSSTFAFVFVLFAKLARGRVLGKLSALSPLALAALWCIFEWTQTLFWFGVPWGRLALGQTELLVTLQSASLLGPYFVSFLIAAVNGMIAYAICNVEGRKLLAVSSAAVFAANLAFGAFAVISRGEPQNTVKVAVIQGNISSTEKWGLGWRKATFDSYSALTEQAAADGAKIVIWPESVVLLYDYQSREDVKKIAAENNVTLLFGALPHMGDEQYNSIITVLPDGTLSEEIYSKRRLVPFGEYVPMKDSLGKLIPVLQDIAMLGNDLTPGEDSNILHTEYGNIGSLICFDSIYEELALDSARDGAGIIAIETNDSWFYDSAAVWMHEGQARMRAIETGKYVVRAANTGVSAIIDPAGEIVEEIPPLVAGYAVGDVEFRDSRTLYTYLGNLWVWISIGAIAGLIVTDTAILISEKKKQL